MHKIEKIQKKLRTGALFTLYFILFSGFIIGDFNWHSLKTKHFTVFYKKGYEKTAWQALETLERQRKKIEEFTKNEQFRMPIVIHDVGTLVGGFADPVYYRMHFFTSVPANRGELGFCENWWSLVSAHEYSHMLHLTKADDFPYFVVSLVGDPALPHLLTPIWFKEGIATFNESSISNYSGRLNDGRFTAYIAAKAKEYKLPDIKSATYQPLEFPGYQSPYVYGSSFIDYLSKKYGNQKIKSVIGLYGSSLNSYFSPLIPSLGIDRTFEKNYGESLVSLWSEWQQYKREKSESFRVDGEQITSRGWYVHEICVDGQRLYYQRRYPVKTGAFRIFWFNEIIERNLETGDEKSVVSTTSSFVSSLKIDRGKLYYAVNDIKRGFSNSLETTFGQFTALHELNLKTGEDRTILEGAIRAFTPLQDGCILYAEDQSQIFGSSLYRLNRDTLTSDLIAETNYLIDEIASDGERIVLSAKRDWENTNLYLLDISTASIDPLLLTPYLERNMKLKDGRLFFTANYGGKYAVYCYDFSTEKVRRLTKGSFALSHDIHTGHSNLYFTSVNSKGYDIYRKHIDPESPEWSEIFPLPPSSNEQIIDLRADNTTVKPSIFSKFNKEAAEQGGYFDNFKELIPKIPPKIMLSLDDERPLLGLGFREKDIVEEISYIFGVFYDPDDDRGKFRLDLHSTFFAPFVATARFNSFDERKLQLGLAYPLYRSLSPGISGIYIGTNANVLQEFDRLEIEPFLAFQFRYPRYFGFFEVRIPLENRTLGSTFSRSGFSARLALTHYLHESEFSIYMQGLYDPGNPLEAFTKIRGYDNPPAGKSGLKFKTELSMPLLQIRKGLWNPNIFIEDLAAVLFIDGIATGDDEFQLAGGVELHLETRVLFQLPLDLGVRLSINRDGEADAAFLVSIPISHF